MSNIDSLDTEQKISGKSCGICNEAINTMLNTGRLTYCDHYFHNECIQPWFSISQCCPLCEMYNIIYNTNGKSKFIKKIKKKELKCELLIESNHKCKKCKTKAKKSNPLLKCSDCGGFNDGFIHVKCTTSKKKSTKLFYCESCTFETVN